MLFFLFVNNITNRLSLLSCTIKRVYEFLVWNKAFEQSRLLFNYLWHFTKGYYPMFLTGLQHFTEGCYPMFLTGLWHFTKGCYPMFLCREGVIYL